MKTARKKLILTQFFSRLGESLLGIFFPFFLLKTFNFTIPQVFLWGAFFYTFLVVFSNTIFPFIRKQLSGDKVLSFGLFLIAVFYGLLSVNLPQNWLFILAITAIYALGLVLFWVEFNTQSFLANKAESRGKFFANYQSVMIGVNIIAPIITGFLLDHNLEKYSLVVAVIFFGLATLVGASIKFPKNHFQSSLKQVWQNQKKLYKNSSLRHGFYALGAGAGFFYLAWGFFFHSVTQNFAAMGILVGVAAVFEVLCSQIMAKHVQRFSFNKLFLVRMADLLIRAVLLFYAPTWLVGIIIVISGILGPIFFLPFMTRVHEYAEKTADKYSFFIFWENALGVARVFLALVLYVSASFFELSTVYLIGVLLAALATFGFKKF